MRVKGHVGGVWSRRANLFCGSKDMSAECGLGGRTCYAGQRTCRWSVVCGEKTPSGSRRPSVECGLGGEFAERVKGHVGGVWSRRRTCRAGQRTCRRSVVCGENLPSGSRRPAAVCGLGGRICRAGQEGRRWSVVCGEKTPSGSRRLSAECGLWRENAT